MLLDGVSAPELMDSLYTMHTPHACIRAGCCDPHRKRTTAAAADAISRCDGSNNASVSSAEHCTRHVAVHEREKKPGVNKLGQPCMEEAQVRRWCGRRSCSRWLLQRCKKTAATSTLAKWDKLVGHDVTTLYNLHMYCLVADVA
jgi:hypothetical protein